MEKINIESCSRWKKIMYTQRDYFLNVSIDDIKNEQENKMFPVLDYYYSVS